MRVTIFALSMLISYAGVAQQGYNIKFKINGLKDTTIYLGNYYGESTYLKDTARVDSNGEFAFFSDKPLSYQGVYFLVLDKTKIFEMVVGTNQHFSMSTATADYVKNMRVDGDIDNKLFFENMLFNMARHQEAEPLLKTIQDSTKAEDNKKGAREALAEINEKVIAYQSEIIANYPATITAKILKASQPIKIPDPPKNPDGTIDSTFQLQWYRDHFFDNFDFSDPALICMPRPMYSEKITEFLDKLFVPQPDTITKAVDTIIATGKKESGNL